VTHENELLLDKLTMTSFICSVAFGLMLILTGWMVFCVLGFVALGSLFAGMLLSVWCQR